MKAKQVAVVLMDAGQLSKLIGSIGRASAKLMSMIQVAAVQCIAQSIMHRNATPAAQLFEAVESGVRRDALVAYFEMFGNLTWSKGEKKVIFCDMEKIPNGRKLEWTPEYALKVGETMWLKAKAEPTPRSMFDVSEEAEKFLERLSRAKGKGVEIKHDALLGRLVATYNAYVGEQYLKNTTALPTEQDVKQAVKGTRKAKRDGTATATPSPESLQQLQEKFGGRPTEVKVAVS